MITFTGCFQEVQRHFFRPEEAALGLMEAEEKTESI